MFNGHIFIRITLLLLPIELLISSYSFSQATNTIQPKQRLYPVSSDCDKPVKIPSAMVAIYGLTVPPKGAGKKNEIKEERRKSIYYFEKEHNTAWYYFYAMVNGELAIEIIPESDQDDYDFLLFRWTDSSFCDAVASQKVKPLRSNLSRSGYGITGGRTGLSSAGTSEFARAGPGASYSKVLPVRKGEKYILVLDNVSENGLGHIIRLGYEKKVELSGIVVDDEQKPIKAGVTVVDENGFEIKKVVTDSVTGEYFMSVPLWERSKYDLVVEGDESFVQRIEIATAALIKTEYKLTNLRTVLPKLKGGKKYKLDGINFYGGQAILLPSAYPSIQALLRLMKKNKRMVIRIEGHINGGKLYHRNGQKLSERRANAVMEYLSKEGIEKERMSTIGFSDKFMLFPDPKNESESRANRRVEINVISVK